MRGIVELRGIHEGKRIFLFGSGSELNELRPDDFAHEITVTMNRVPLFWPLCPTYALTKYHDDAHEMLNQTLVVPRGDRGYFERTDLSDFVDGYVYDHLQMVPGYAFEWPQDPDWLAVGPTVQITALHFAAYLGASETICLGCTGEEHVRGYYTDDDTAQQRAWLPTVREAIAVGAREVEARYPTKLTWGLSTSA